MIYRLMMGQTQRGRAQSESGKVILLDRLPLPDGEQASRLNIAPALFPPDYDNPKTGKSLDLMKRRGF